MFRKIFLPISLLFAVSCADSPNTRSHIPMNSLEDVLTNLAPLEEVFVIAADKESVITGKEGTAVYIPANAFQFLDGTTPKGNVQVELKECYSITSMIGEKLHTTSGSQLLETGGMIRLTATADGKELELKEGAGVVIGFPKQGNTSEMDIFYDFHLNDTVSTWVADYQMYEAEAEVNGSTIEVSEMGNTTRYPIEMTDDLYEYHPSICYVSDFLQNIKLKGTGTTLFEYIADSLNLDNEVVKALFLNDWHVHFDITIDKTGKIGGMKVQTDIEAAPKYIADAIIEAMSQVPSLDLESSTTPIKLNEELYLGFAVNSKKLNTQRFKKQFRDQFTDLISDASVKLGRSDVDTYIFASTRLGWINCDRFLDLKDEQKTDYIVRTDHAEDVTVQLVFNDIRSIMPGQLKDGQIEFKNVPIGSSVKVIGISYANGMPTMSTLQTTIDTDGADLLVFEEFSLDELDAQLN